MSESHLWDFNCYYGRSGTVSGMFIAAQKEVDDIIGKTVYFGEILGKHSEVYFRIEKRHLTKVDVSQECVSELFNAYGSNTLSGYNPLDYYDDEDEE